ncbi:hypothetical protein [Marinobacterium stanieri]|uniref:hypothetical protein n=1 Tax=Marinobacterium stanieri TaxID=49186 RepID=UPI00025588A2|nr:hypothetical protein [Marinobacterium stanieri]
MFRFQTLPNTTAAFRYRRLNQLTGGVVILNHGIPTDWMSELGNPNTWQPGVTAVDADGNEWIAMDGNEIQGATRWCQLSIGYEEGKTACAQTTP